MTTQTQHAAMLAALDADGCERIKDFYSVGPVQKAAVESFAAALLAADSKAGGEVAARVSEVHMSRYTVEWANGPLPEGTRLYARAALAQADQPAVPQPEQQAQVREPLIEGHISPYGHDTYYREIIAKLERDIRALHLAIGISGAKRDAEAAELRAALVGCEKDAARYRFIRDANRSDVIAFELRHYAMETLDEYVDAAMDGELDAAITQAQGQLK